MSEGRTEPSLDMCLHCCTAAFIGCLLSAQPWRTLDPVVCAIKTLKKKETKKKNGEQRTSLDQTLFSPPFPLSSFLSSFFLSFLLVVEFFLQDIEEVEAFQSIRTLPVYEVAHSLCVLYLLLNWIIAWLLMGCVVADIQRQFVPQ